MRSQRTLSPFRVDIPKPVLAQNEYRPNVSVERLYNKFMKFSHVRGVLDELAYIAKQHYFQFETTFGRSCGRKRCLWLDFGQKEDFHRPSFIFDISSLKETCLYDISYTLKDYPFREPLLRFMSYCVEFESLCIDNPQEPKLHGFSFSMKYQASDPRSYVVGINTFNW